MTRTFTAKHAIRESVPLFVGLMGPSGSGKTFSALRLATGIQAVTGGDIVVIDTESRRALHYADAFKFKHIQFDAPFGSLDYLAALQQSVEHGARVIVVDSMSHEHSSLGGYLLTQEEELDRIAGSDWGKRERAKFTAWIKPAKLRQQMIDGILHLGSVNLILCFRAKEKTKPIKRDGKTEVVEMGFMPVAGEELLFEMTVNCLLLPKAGGVPTWRSDQVGERLMMKLPHQFEHIFAKKQPLSEEIGRHLAEWARGGAVPRGPAASEPEQPAADEDADSTDDFGEFGGRDVTDYDDELTTAALGGMASLEKCWRALPREIRATLKSALDTRHKPAAAAVDTAKSEAA